MYAENGCDFREGFEVSARAKFQAIANLGEGAFNKGNN